MPEVQAQAGEHHLPTSSDVGASTHLSLAVLLVALLVYLLIPTREYYWDGIGFALQIEHARGNLPSLIQPNHLVYSLVGYLVWRGLEILNVSVRVLYVLQALNAIVAAVTVFFVWRILFATKTSLWHATVLAALFAFSATWWDFATNIDAYIPSIFFMVLSFWYLMPDRRPRPLMIAALHAAAMVMHQLSLFFFPVAVVCLWRQQSDKGRRLVTILQYAVPVAVLTAGLFVSAYVLSGAQDFWRWITFHSQDSSFSFDLPLAIELTLRGTLRLFFGGRYSLLRTDVISVAAAITLGTALVLLVWSLARVRHFRRLELPSFHAQAIEGMPIFVWIGVYVLFLLFWLPQNTFYRLFYLPALIFVCGLAGGYGKRGSRALALFVFTVFVWNFTFFIYPHSRTQSNEVLTFALNHRADWPRSSTIVYRRFHSDLWTISYFNPQASWQYAPGDPAQMETLRANLERTGATLWLEGTAYDALNDTAVGRTWIRDHIDGAGSLVYTSRAHRIRFFRVRR